MRQVVWKRLVEQRNKISGCRDECLRRNKYALDNFCCASDSLASRFQSPRGRRSDSYIAGGSVGGLGDQPDERPARSLEKVFRKTQHSCRADLPGPRFYLCWKRARRLRLVED